MSLPRSVYAERFRDFADFTFGDAGDAGAFEHRGQWGSFFEKRMGTAFNGRVILEMGCFDAAYLSNIAAKFPDTAFIGVDWKCKALYDGAQRIAGFGLRNIALLRCRAQDVLKIVAPGEVDEIWVFHPDPCARDVELKNRLIGEPFLIDVHQALRDGTSTLSLKTDHPGYYQWVLGLLGLPEPHWFGADAGHRQLASPSPRLRLRDLMPRQYIPRYSAAICSRFEVTMNSSDYWNDPAALAHCAARLFSGNLTLFETRFVTRQLPIYYLELRKKSH